MTEEFKLKSDYFKCKYTETLYYIVDKGNGHYKVFWQIGNQFFEDVFPLSLVSLYFENGWWVWCDFTGTIIEESTLFAPTLEKQSDPIKNPKHYQLLEGVEVKDVNKALLDKMEAAGYDITLFEAGWYQQAMQYFMRFYAKNGINDLEKGVETMQFVINSMKGRQNG